MRTTFPCLVAAIAVLFVGGITTAQTNTGANSQGGLRARLPFSGSSNANSGQLGSNRSLRPTTGPNATGGNYGGWGSYGNLGGGGASSVSPYPQGRGAMVRMQRPNVNGIGANNFNPASPNATRPNASGGSDAGYQAGTVGEDVGWMDYEPAPETAYPAGAANRAGGAQPSNTSNAVDAPALTAATAPGANQVVRAAGEAGVRTSNMPVSGVAGPASDLQAGYAASQQPATRWRFYETPLVDRAPVAQQPSSSNASADNSALPTPSQQPSGVAEAASSGPIKY